MMAPASFLGAKVARYDKNVGIIAVIVGISAFLQDQRCDFQRVSLSCLGI